MGRREQEPHANRRLPAQYQRRVVQRRFGLSMLVEISGVDAATIKRWQNRGTMKFPRVGFGTDRTYTINDALHLAIVSEMAGLGLTITGKGADLADSLAGYAGCRLRDDPSIERLGSAALIPRSEESDWLMDANVENAICIGHCIIFNLGRIAELIFRRSCL